jgi:hypothetical protein
MTSTPLKAPIETTGALRRCTSRGSNPDPRILSPLLSPIKVLVPCHSHLLRPRSRGENTGRSGVARVSHLHARRIFRLPHNRPLGLKQ